MASNQQTSFERSLDIFRQELSDDQIKRMDGVNQETLKDTIQATQNILGRRNDLCKLSRVQGFLQAMEHVEKLVTIFLNTNDFVAFIWGPIKLALMVATTWTDAIRQLIDAYEEIAEVLGNLAFFHTLIKSRDHLKLILEDYFSDILRFHRCVLDVFSRPEWKRIFKWAWGSFRREVKPILESLRRKQALLTDDKLQSHAILKEVQDSEQYAKSQFSSLQTSLEEIRSTLASKYLKSKNIRAQEMKTYLESRLDVSKSRSDLQLETPDPIVENSGNWIFSNPIFKCWEVGKSAENRILFLNGSPGSGKSTLAKTVIRHEKRKQAAESSRRSFLTYFFFKHDASKRSRARSMLQHLIMQLVNADETIMGLVYEKLSTMESTELSDLKKLASDCFTARPMATLILDGLDEAMDNEHEVSINWCLNELFPVAKSRSCNLKALICGQRDGRLDALLSSYPQIRLDKVDDHKKDIEQFTKGQAAKIRARFSLTREEEESLISKISGASEGMFLYARVVLDNLAAMDSIQEFEDELEGETFPKDLDQAYDRIAQRILNKHGPSRRGTVKKILGWVICATRPLRWREIQSLFCINTERQTCNIRNMRRDSCKSICSSLVDVTYCDMFPNIESEQFISMVHETATKYLVRNGTVNLFQEHIDMALFCCRYLSSRPFTSSKSQNITADIHSGYFGYLDYAAAHYTIHIQKSEASELSTDSALKLEATRKATLDLAKTIFGDSAVQPEERDRTAQDLKSAIEDNVLAVRTLIGLQRETSETAIFDATEGPLRYKCHRVRCAKFAVGFSNEAALKKHFAAHERPFRCPHSDCFAHTVGYASPKRLESHNEAFHHNTTKSKAIFPTELEAGELDLYGACNAGDLDEVKRFHREGADIHDTVRTFVTPLCVAVEAGHGHICRYLVDNGVDPFHFTCKGRIEQVPVGRAIHLERLEILEFFLLHGSGPDDSTLAENIARAIHARSPVALNMCLTIRQPRDHEKVIKAVLYELISQSPNRLVEADSHSFDTTLVHAWFQYVKPVFYNEKGIFTAQSDCAEYEIWGDIFFRQLDYFHAALERRCYSVAAFLMDIGNDEYLQLKHRNGGTPLHSCIRWMCKRDCSSCMAMVQRLLQYDGGKFANVMDSDARLPLHIALGLSTSQAVLRAVIDHTEDMNVRDNLGHSPLQMAISKNKPTQSIRVLVENRSVDLFSRNNEGQTAFSVLSGKLFGDVVGALEALFDADPRLAWTPDESKDGLTPFHHAMRQLESHELDSYNLQSASRAAKFLLTCSVVKRVLVGYQAKSSDADQRKVRDFAEKEMLREALDIMDAIGFSQV
ncbi:heterokaryon incompatibility protein het-E-1 [Fusarium globosum]|uniref:Heterokaryon incompatibility protein het-E-1 n=1 Tax=Fusarium globosum TaxID=78864 RepID=A0A8H6DF15_9HYPO|nr:heterokaryon incompatibility protein het-E-1 [Fusarium globosum]